MRCQRAQWGSGRVQGSNASPGQIAVPDGATVCTLFGPVSAGSWTAAWRRGSGDPPVVFSSFTAGGAPPALAIFLIPPDARILEYSHSLGSDAFVAWGSHGDP